MVVLREFTTQAPPQGADRPKQVGFYAAFIDVDDSGDFPGGVSLIMTEGENQALLWGQSVQGGIDSGPDLAVPGSSFRVGGGGCVGWMGHGVILQGESFPCFSPAKGIQTAVGSDAVDPGGEVPGQSRIEPVEIAEGFDERVLENIFGVGLIPEEPEGQGEDPSMMGVEEAFPGGGIAGLSQPD